MSKKLLAMLHSKCRGKFYPRTNSTVSRLAVSDSKVPWSVEWSEYSPEDFTASHIKNQPWADPDVADCNFHPIWNALDGKVNRKSHTGEYLISNLRPMNPIGRTGLAGRGVLGRWGPNHAADPIVSRWKRNSTAQKEYHPVSKKPILQIVVIQRKDSGEWAIPGGMVDPGEVVTLTLKREFLEEALNALELNPEKLAESKQLINAFFDNGEHVYKGYVDDPRNTDNAWMETIAMNFHDKGGNVVGALSLQAGDDAANVTWMDISKDLDLYANHIDFVAEVAKKHEAHW